MYRKSTLLALIGAVSAATLFAGCTAESNGPPVEGSESTEARTYSSPSPPPEPPKRTLAEKPGCRKANTAEEKATTPRLRSAQASQKDIRVTPIFTGSPDVDDITLSDHQGKKWLNEWSHDVDQHKLLLTVVQNPDEDFQALTDDDMEDVQIRHAETVDNAIGLKCDEPVQTSTRFIGEQPGEGRAHPTTMWEVSSDEDVASDPEQLLTAWIDGEELNQMGAVHVMDQANDVVASLGSIFPARRDLAFYYDNR